MSDVAAADRQRILDEMATIEWFHFIELGAGICTPGKTPNLTRVKRLRMPTQLTGKSVLDVGAWDGFYSFEAEKRGARRVLATDHFCWGGSGWGTKDGFNFAHKILGFRVESLEVDVLEITPETVGTFDVVLFLGVLYHMRCPLLVLDRIAAVTDGQLILETIVDLTNVGRPALAFYPERELANDPTNWFGPNESALHAMLQAAGFQDVETVSRPETGYPFEGSACSPEPEAARLVVHAWK